MARFGWNLTAERELWAGVCAPEGWHSADGTTRATHPESLWWFIHIAWGAEWYFRSGNKRWLTERVHKPYLKWLQNTRLDWLKQRRSGHGERFYVAIVIPRNFGKTITSTKACALWSHVYEPDLSSVIASEDNEKAEQFLGSIKKVLSGDDENAWFCWLYGQWKNPERDWVKKKIVHGARKHVSLSEPSFDTASVDAGITGYHPADAWWDDPLSANKLRAGGMWLGAVHSAFDATFPAVQTDGWIALVVTRYLDDDIAGRRIREDGVLEWCGMEPPNSTYFNKIPRGKGMWRVYFFQAEDSEGKPTLPEVMNEIEIARAKARDAIDYSCQYLNDPGSGEHMPLVESQIRDMFLDRAKLRELPIAYATIHLDTAFKREETIGKGDDSVIAIFLHDSRSNGIVYFDRALVSNEWRDEHFMEQLVAACIDLRRRGIWIKCITDETEMGGKQSLFKNHILATLRGAGISVGAILQFPRQGTRKTERIRTAAGYWADGYVRLLCPMDQAGVFQPALVPGLSKLIHQMLRVGVATHDDIADASADVFSDKVWTRPNFGVYSNAPEFGAFTRRPGDESLKEAAKPISNDELRDLYDATFRDLNEVGIGLKSARRSYTDPDPWVPPRDSI